MTVEGAVVEPFRLPEDDPIGILLAKSANAGVRKRSNLGEGTKVNGDQLGPPLRRKSPGLRTRGSMSMSQLPSSGSSAMTMIIWSERDAVVLSEINRTYCRSAFLCAR